MPLGFPCAQCQQPIVVRFLREGDPALCLTCGGRTPVPPDAAVVDATPADTVVAAPPLVGTPPEGDGSGAPEAPTSPHGAGLAEAVPREGECLNHPGVAAVGYCALCAESFCPDCLDSGGTGARCRPCFLGTTAGAVPEGSFLRVAGPVPCRLATEALIMSLIGVVCFGIILEPLALYRGIKARKEIRESPYPMSGEGVATAAIIIASVMLTLNVLMYGVVFLTALITSANR